MPDRPPFLENSLIVGAHPDDELLWFASILPAVDAVIVVYRDYWADPALGPARAAALADYPRGIASLDLAEAGVHGCADWTDPRPDAIGLAFGRRARLREMKRRVVTLLPSVGPLANAVIAPDNVASLHRANFARIANALRPRLSADMNVFTHNPWGEYGHEEHVQLFRVLDMLRGEIGFTLWMSNYCTERSLPLAMRYFEAAPGPFFRLPTDKAFAERVADTYRRHGCWTWAEDWAWFDDECFMEAPRGDRAPGPHRHLFPLNLFSIGG